MGGRKIESEILARPLLPYSLIREVSGIPGNHSLSNYATIFSLPNLETFSFDSMADIPAQPPHELYGWGRSTVTTMRLPECRTGEPGLTQLLRYPRALKELSYERFWVNESHDYKDRLLSTTAVLLVNAMKCHAATLETLTMTVDTSHVRPLVPRIQLEEFAALRHLRIMRSYLVGGNRDDGVYEAMPASLEVLEVYYDMQVTFADEEQRWLEPFAWNKRTRLPRLRKITISEERSRRLYRRAQKIEEEGVTGSRSKDELVRRFGAVVVDLILSVA